MGFEVKESIADKFKRTNNRIKLAEKVIKEQKPDWDESVEIYHGKIISPNISDFSDFLTHVNLWYVDMRSGVPKLYSKNPYIFIDPDTEDADVAAEVLEKVVNERLKVWKLKERVRGLIQGTKLKGRGYLKTSYKFDGDKIGREFISGEPNDEITINYISREKLLIDPDAISFDARRWAAHKICLPIREIKATYKLREDDKPTIKDPKDLPESFNSEDREDFQYGTIYEIESLEDNKLSVIVEGVDRFVVKPYNHPYGWSMYDALEWNKIPEVLDTKSDLHFWKKQLIELAETRTQQVNHRRKLNSKYVLTGTKPTETQVAQLTSYKDGSIVVLGADQSLQPMQHAQLGAEVYTGEQAVRQDITIISGMNEMKQGVLQQQKTAREAMAIYQEAQDVVSDRAALVDDVIASVITKCIKLIQENYDTQKVIAISGMEQAEFLGFKDRVKGKEGISISGTAKRPYISFVGTQLTGDLTVRVQPGSSRPVDENQRKEEILQLLPLIQQNQQLTAVLDWKELAKEIGKLWHLDAKKVIIDPKSPNQENAFLKRNIPVMPDLNEPHDEHINAHEMENNNTPAFIAHLMTHKLMKQFLGQPAQSAASPQSSGLGLFAGLNKENISGFPMGSSEAPGEMTQPPMSNSSGASQPGAGIAPSIN